MELLKVEQIKAAQEGLKGVAKKTELDYSRTFSELSVNQVYLKLENLQRTGSFKIRGAYNKISNLNIEEKEAGVVAASAGNHAQGVALAASQAGIESTVIMPKGAPIAKIKATESYGARVILGADNYDQAAARAVEYAQKTGSILIPAFDDLDIIAGQGTIGLEVLKQLAEVEVVLVPIGGGGLIAGIATAIKELKPEVEIIGVEAEQASSMKSSLIAGKPITLTEIDTIADGIAIKSPGQLTYPIIAKYIERIVTVDEAEIAYTISILLERSKLVVEGAGAVTLAALLNNKLGFQNKKVVAILSGGNIDLDMVATIINRGLLKGGRRVVLSTCIADIPGSLKELLEILSHLGANVISINHDRLYPGISLKQVEVKLLLETRDQKHIEKIIAALESEDYDLKRLR